MEPCFRFCSCRWELPIGNNAAAGTRQSPAIPRHPWVAVPTTRWPAETDPSAQRNRRNDAYRNQSAQTDYGDIVEDWRKEVFDTAVNRIYLWSIFVLCLVVSVSLLGNVWLLRQRQRRLAISANIVVQLFNAYVGSRAKSLEVIAKYNALVERYNRLNDDRNTATSEQASDSDDKSQHRVDSNRAKQDKGIAQSGSTAVTTSPTAPKVDADGNVSEFEALRSQLQEYETKLQRKDAQLQAKDNQITNLRGRLTRAHDSLEGERLQKSEAK